MAHEKMFSWHTFLYSRSQWFKKVSTWLDISYRQETHRIANQNDALLSKRWLNFPNFNSISQHKTQHYSLKEKMEQEVTLRFLRMNDLNDRNPQDELQLCKQNFSESEIGMVRLKILIYAMETLCKTIGEEKINHLFRRLNCAAKVEV